MRKNEKDEEGRIIAFNEGETTLQNHVREFNDFKSCSK